MSDRPSADILPMKCLDCGCILDNSPENCCPECGREFDPADSYTYSGGDPENWPVQSGMPYIIGASVGMLLSLAPVIFMAAGGEPGGGAFPFALSDGLMSSCMYQPLGALLGLGVVIMARHARSLGRCAESMNVAVVIAWISMIVGFPSLFLRVALAGCI